MTTPKLWRSWFLEPVCQPPPTAVSDPWKYVIIGSQQCSSQQQEQRLSSRGRGRVLDNNDHDDVGDGQTDRLATAPAVATAAKESNAYVRTRDNGGGAADTQTAFSQSFAFRCRVRSSSSSSDPRDVCRRRPNVRACVYVCCVVFRTRRRLCVSVCARSPVALFTPVVFFQFNFYRVRIVFSHFFGNILATILSSWFIIQVLLYNPSSYSRWCENIIKFEWWKPFFRGDRLQTKLKNKGKTCTSLYLQLPNLCAMCSWRYRE